MIYGNAGTGKSTLAKKMMVETGLPLLDLDTVAWDEPGIREAEETTFASIKSFIDTNEYWVIEGCYGSMIKELTNSCTELYFLNPGIDASVNNNAKRLWEPHKYESMTIQNAHFDKLQEWVKQYKNRKDEFSYDYHRKIFSDFSGVKYEYARLEEYCAL